MKDTRRRGTVMLVTMFLLGFAMLMIAVVLSTYLTSRHELQDEQSCLQAGWLAEAGLERAAARLASQADYSGETWTISAGNLGGNDGGVVRIRVEAVDGKPNRRSVHVEADYPDHPQYRVRETRQATMDRRDQP
jgi:type II secretory pathway component PulK